MDAFKEALPTNISNKLSIIIENSSIGNVIYNQSNQNTGDVINGPVTNYLGNSKETDEAVKSLVTKFDQKEIEEKFAARDYRQARELILKIVNNFAPYHDFIISQVLARDLSPIESVNYGSVLLGEMKYGDDISVYEELLKNIDSLPEGNKNELFNRLSFAAKDELGDSLFNSLIKNQINSTTDLKKIRMLKILQNKVQGFTTTRDELISQLKNVLNGIENTMLLEVKDISFNDSTFLIGIDFLYTYNNTQPLNYEYEFDNVLNELKSGLSTLASKYNNNGYLVLNFKSADKIAYKTFVSNFYRFKSGKYLDKKPKDFFTILQNPCLSIDNLCLSKIKEIVPDRVFKKLSDSNDNKIFADIFIAIENNNESKAMELLDSYLKKNSEVNYELVFHVMENLVNENDGFPDHALQILDEVIKRKNTLAEVDIWKGRLLKIKGMYYLYDKYGCGGEKKYLAEGKKTLLQSLVFNPELAESYMNLCFVYCIESDFAEAMEAAKNSEKFAGDDLLVTNSSKVMQLVIEANKENLNIKFKDVFCRSKHSNTKK